jgi:HSP20 family protein
MPWPFNDQPLKPLFDDDFFPRFGMIPASFPRLDIEDKGNFLLITADVPGVEQKDIDIEAEEDRVIIQGKTEEEKEEKRKNFYRKERKSGGFYREVPLPVPVDPDKVTAKFKNGTLEISLPKKGGTKEKRVKINVK